MEKKEAIEVIKKNKESLVIIKQAIRQLATNGVAIKPLIDATKAIEEELTESEDERVRKESLDFCKNRAEKYSNDPKYKNISAWIAWLEKQCEQKASYTTIVETGNGGINALVTRELPIDGEQKPADKVEPIFKIGDKIQYLKGCGTIMTIEKIEDGEYIFGDNMGHTTIESGNKWHLVNLVEHKPAWSEEDENINECIQWTLIDKQVKEKEPNKYNREINWLKSLKNRVQPIPKQEWSEEDEKKLRGICDYISCSDSPEGFEEWIDFLISLKDRVVPQQELSKKDIDAIEIKAYNEGYAHGIEERDSTEWNDKDEECFRNACNACWDYYGKDSDTAIWLKSLRPQSQWKPSEEQMKALSYYLKETIDSEGVYGTLVEELYHDLKKLTD